MANCLFIGLLAAGGANWKLMGHVSIVFGLGTIWFVSIRTNGMTEYKRLS